jgi:hypothetical protein
MRGPLLLVQSALLSPAEAIMRSAQVRVVAIMALLMAAGTVGVQADEPTPKPENTVSISVEPVKPQTFPRPVKFFLDKVVDRSGNRATAAMFDSDPLNRFNGRRLTSF